MATESDLRDLLRGPEPEGRGDIDLEAVLSRARRRRRPRMIAAQALGSVALIGALGTVVIVSLPPAQTGVMMTAEDGGAGDSAATAPDADENVQEESGSTWAPDSCGAPVTDRESIAGLTLEMEPITVVTGTTSVPVTVVLRNDGPTRVVGVSGGSPHLTLSLDGLVVWHSYSVQDSIGIGVDLEPGESQVYQATFQPALCTSEDDLVVGTSDNPLPPAGPGSYELRASMPITPDDPASNGGQYVASGSAVAVEIR